MNWTHLHIATKARVRARSTVEQQTLEMLSINLDYANMS